MGRAIFFKTNSNFGRQKRIRFYKKWVNFLLKFTHEMEEINNRIDN